jgi:DNA replication protein DnaC
VNPTSEISPELIQVLRRLKLSPILDTLPERLVLARQSKMPYQDFLLVVLGDEAERRDGNAVRLRASKARLEPHMRLENWDDTAAVTFDRQLWAELCTLRFIRSCHNVLLLGPVGVGKTFLAACLGHIACRLGRSALMLRAEHLFKTLKASRLDNSHERELRRLIALDLLIIDDFGLDQMDSNESRDFYELVVERHRQGSIVVTSNREPQEWLALMADPIRAQSAVDRLQNSAYELVVEGESYRKRQKPSLAHARPSDGP